MRRSLLKRAGVNEENRFIISVKSDNIGSSGTNQFTIPTIEVGYLYDIETSDGYTATGITGNHTITFPSGAGTYDVFISGDFPRIYFNNTGDKLKILEVKNWGIYAIGSTNQFSAFRGCSNLDFTATDSGNFENVTNFQTFIRESSVTTLGNIVFDSSTRFTAFALNSSIENVRANIFDNCTATSYNTAFQGSNLTQTSIDNILVSIDTAGQSGGTFNHGGPFAPSVIGENAIDNLRARGWTVTVQGGY